MNATKTLHCLILLRTLISRQFCIYSIPIAKGIVQNYLFDKVFRFNTGAFISSERKDLFAYLLPSNLYCL